MVFGFTGEVAVVGSKGVGARMLSIISKLDWLDAGLQVGAVSLVRIGVNVAVDVEIGCTVVWLSTKRPRLSLVCLKFFVCASIAILTVSRLSCLMSPVTWGAVTYVVEFLFLSTVGSKHSRHQMEWPNVSLNVS
jgi:hypothetical protein